MPLIADWLLGSGVLLLIGGQLTTAVTHWMVTEDGLRIEAASDSLYNMAQPHDLVGFLKQELRAKTANSAEHDITNHKNTIRKHEEIDDPKIEEKIMTTDKNCAFAGKVLSKHDLHLSTALSLESLGLNVGIFIGQPSDASEMPTVGLLKPFCGSVYKLPFSMAAFEHLDAMYRRRNLSMLPESDLSPFVLSGWENATEFAYQVTFALKQNPMSWQLYNMASFYWRIVGDAPEAVECIRRALYFSHRRFVAVALLNLVNVLHRSGFSVDASVVADTLTTYNHSLAVAHCAYAQILATNMHYNESVEAFDRCLQLDADFPHARKLRAAVLCQQTLEEALESQHENLQQTLTELHSYQARLQQYRDAHDTLLDAVAAPEVKLQDALAYDYFTLPRIKEASCGYLRNGDTQLKELQCIVDDYEQYEKARDQLNIERRRKLRQQAQIQQRNNAQQADSAAATEAGEQQLLSVQTTPQNEANTIESDAEKLFTDQLEQYQGKDVIGPSLFSSPRYHEDENPISMDDDWLTTAMCEQMQTPSVTLFPQLFLSPVHKKYPVYELLTDYLNLRRKAEHPLPWYPPFCATLLTSASPVNLPCCDHLLGVQRAKKRDRDQTVPESDLLPVFLNLTGSHEDASLSEVGQRINTLLKYKIGPRWIVLNMAALYWRVVGVSAEATACLRLALSETGESEADVSLVQLSRLAAVAGERVDDGLVLLKQALDVDDTQPETHILLAYSLLLKGNQTGAKHHSDAALQLDNKYAPSIEMWKRVHCASRIRPKKRKKTPVVAKTEYRGVVRHRPDGAQCQMDGPRQTILARAAMQKLFCLKVRDGEGCFVEENRVNTMQGCNAAYSVYLPVNDMSLYTHAACIPPPTQALLFLLQLQIQWFQGGDEVQRSGFFCEMHPKPIERSKPLALPPAKSTDEIATSSSSKKAAANTNTVTEREGEEGEDKDEDDADEVPLDFGLDSLQQLQPSAEAQSNTERAPPSKTVVSYEQKVKKNDVKQPVSATPIKKTPLVINSPKPANDPRTEEQRNRDLERLRETLDRSQAIAKEQMARAQADLEKENRQKRDAGLPVLDRERLTILKTDSPLPELIPLPSRQQMLEGVKLLPVLPSSKAECAKWTKRVNFEQATSTWLSVSAKGVKLEPYVDFDMMVPGTKSLEPRCPDVNTTLLSMDHLSAYWQTDKFTLYKPEKALKDAFMSLGPRKESPEHMASRLTLSMLNSLTPNAEAGDSGVSWAVSTVSSLYWRVNGNATEAIRCLRHAVTTAPANMRDLALVSMANVYHQAGMLHSALITGGAALRISPRFVVIHFTLANVFASLGDLENAMRFYYSTLSLQNNFEPARERIKAIHCLTQSVPPELNGKIT